MDAPALALQVLYGLSVASILLLIALGLAIIFGLMGVINMAHGEFIMLGAYTVYLFRSQLGFNFMLSAALAFVVVALVGFLMETSVIRALYGRPLETLLATWGIGVGLRQIIILIFGTELRYVGAPLQGAIRLWGGNTFPYFRLLIIGITLLLLAVTYFVLFKTRFGMQLRAVTQNRNMTACLGVDTAAVDRLTFAFGSGLAGVAGAMIAPIKSVSPAMGLDYLVDAFMVVVIGGVGQLVGAIAGSLAIGEANVILSLLSDEVTAKVLIFTLIIIALRLRPSGMFVAAGRR